MKRLMVCLALAAAGCKSSTPLTPPPPDPPPNMTPASIRLTLASRPDFQTTVTATVYSVSQLRVPNLPVAFATAAGTVTPAQAVTDAQGMASALLNSPKTTLVSATIGGGITAAVDVTGASPPGVVTSPPPTFPPDPPTSTPSAILNVTPRGTTGIEVTFSVAAPAGHAWTWSFGDGGSAQTTTYTTTHKYTSAGTFDATVSSPGVTTGTATIVISDPPPSTGPPPGTKVLIATLSCTPVAHGGATPCNVSSLTYGADFVPSGKITSVEWDWGDGFTITTVPPTAASSTRTYVSAGTYNVIAKVTATTDDGAKTATVTKSITVP